MLRQFASTTEKRFIFFNLLGFKLNSHFQIFGFHRAH